MTGSVVSEVSPHLFYSSICLPGPPSRSLGRSDCERLCWNLAGPRFGEPPLADCHSAVQRVVRLESFSEPCTHWLHKADYKPQRIPEGNEKRCRCKGAGQAALPVGKVLGPHRPSCVPTGKTASKERECASTLIFLETTFPTPKLYCYLLADITILCIWKSSWLTQAHSLTYCRFTQKIPT